jgi:hypothetical protein
MEGAGICSYHWAVRVKTRVSFWGQGQVAGSCEQGNNILGPVKGGKYPDNLKRLLTSRGLRSVECVCVWVSEWVSVSETVCEVK